MKTNKYIIMSVLSTLTVASQNMAQASIQITADEDPVSYLNETLQDSILHSHEVAAIYEARYTIADKVKVNEFNLSEFYLATADNTSNKDVSAAMHLKNNVQQIAPKNKSSDATTDGYLANAIQGMVNASGCYDNCYDNCHSSRSWR